MDNTSVAIVTGGGKGIGAEIAMHLLSQNYRVVVADIQAIRSLLEDRSRLLYIRTDIRKEDSIKKMIKKTLKHFGRIDVLINDAGILPTLSTTLESTSLKKWNDFISTNLTGAFLCAKHAVRYLRKNRGSIVNIGSTRALQSEGNDVPYAASKGGLVALTHALAINLGPDVRVNCISPGWIHTDKTPLRGTDHSQHPAGRVGQPSDIASMTAYLISPQAEFITGQNFVVDGGMTVKMIYLD